MKGCPKCGISVVNCDMSVKYRQPHLVGGVETTKNLGLAIALSFNCYGSLFIKYRLFIMLYLFRPIQDRCGMYPKKTFVVPRYFIHQSQRR